LEELRYESRTNSGPFKRLFCPVLTFVSWCRALPPRKCSMGETGTAKARPYCEGKGYVTVVSDLPSDDDPRKEPNRMTWARKACALRDGKGSISGDGSTHRSCLLTRIHPLLHSSSGQFSLFPVFAFTRSIHCLTRKPCRSFGGVPTFRQFSDPQAASNLWYCKGRESRPAIAKGRAWHGF
jgi:hypothetical protein